MEEYRHEDIRRLFDMVIQVPATERQSVLDRECAGDEGLKQRILGMITAAEDDRFLGQPTSAGLDELTLDNLTAPLAKRVLAAEHAGQQIGRYKLLEQIGEGGFGSVWAAEQREPVKRRVALKIIKLGMDTKQVIARFEAERQALAMMDHPNIAKVFDAGTSETGRPYFVMELVKGVPVLDYCDKEKLDTRARLRLFATVCHAIQHAHQKGIIHRDIKPSNVLITLHDGVPVPKVIDFGIAKATNAELTSKTVYTEHRQMIGTPAYMSPEQAEMSGLDIDTRSDIYSLGVLLYELLTGTTPFAIEELMSKGFAEMMRIIREDEPHKPSTRLSSLGETGTRTALQRGADMRRLSLLLRGDLDWIVMRCLEKDRTRRYETASGLAADIMRHLSDEPVLAGPPSTKYRLAKFVKRNRGQVIAGGVIAAALLLGLAGTTYGLFRASMLSRLAEQRAGEAESARAAEAVRADELRQVVDFQSEQLGSVVPELMGARIREAIIKAAALDEREALWRTLGAINFTDIGLESLEKNVFEPGLTVVDERFSAQPLIQAQLYQATADRLVDFGRFESARPPQERALEIRQDELGLENEFTIESIVGMGRVLQIEGAFDEAERRFRDALEACRLLKGDDHPSTLNVASALGSLLKERGDLDEAESLWKDTLEARRRVLGDDHPDTLGSIEQMGIIYDEQGKHDDAVRHYREAFEGRRRILGDDHPDTLASMESLGSILGDVANYDEAARYLLAALEGHRRLLGEDHPETLLAFNSMGYLRYQEGKLDEAESFWRRSLEGHRRILGDLHPDTLLLLNNMGNLHKSQGRLVEAESCFVEALEGRRRVLGEAHPSTLQSINNMGGLMRSLERFAEAEEYYRQCADACQRILGDEHPWTLISIKNLGRALEDQGRPDEAEELYHQVLATQRSALGEDHPDTISSIHAIGYLLWDQERFDEAEPWWRDALERRRRVLGDDHPATIKSIGNLGQLRFDQGVMEEAEALEREALDRNRFVHGDRHAETLKSLRYCGRVLRARGALDEAEAMLRESVEGYRGIHGSLHDQTLHATFLLAALLNERERPAEAEALLRPFVDATDLKVAAWRLAQAKSVLGESLERLGRHADAEPLLLEGYDGLDAGAPREDRRTMAPAAASRLVRLYEAMDRLEDAEKWRLLSHPEP